MADEKKPKGKPVKLPETAEQDKPLKTSKTISDAQEFARRLGPLALGLFEARTEKNKSQK